MKTFRVRLLKIWIEARHRDDGFLQDAFLHSRLDLDVLVFEEDVFIRLMQNWPKLNKFRGLGDVERKAKVNPGRSESDSTPKTACC